MNQQRNREERTGFGQKSWQDWREKATDLFFLEGIIELLIGILRRETACDEAAF